jgi:hypothetical protein
MKNNRFLRDISGRNFGSAMYWHHITVYLFALLEDSNRVAIRDPHDPAFERVKEGELTK